MTHTFKDAYKRIAALPGRVKAVMASVLAAGIAALGFFSAGGFNGPALVAPPFPNSVSAPPGYQVTYAHDFTTQGMGDWVTQPGAGATVSVSSSYGLGVEVTGEDLAGVDASHEELEAAAIICHACAALDEDAELERLVAGGVVEGIGVIGDGGLREG